MKEFKETKTSVNVKERSKDISKELWENSYSTETNEDDETGLTDDDTLFLQQGGEALAFSEVLKASYNGTVTDNDYSAMVGGIVEDEAYQSLLSKDPKDLTEAEKNKVDLRRAVMLKSVVSKDKRDRFDELTKKGLNNLNDKERSEFYALEGDIAEGFGETFTEDFENNIFSKRAFQTASMMAGFSIQGETAFDGLNTTAIENTYQSAVLS